MFCFAMIVHWYLFFLYTENEQDRVLERVGKSCLPNVFGRHTAEVAEVRSSLRGEASQGRK